MRDKLSEQAVKKLAEELLKLRKARGYSHQTLAELAGVTRPAISYIETHKRVPSLLTCLKLAKALDVRLTDLLDKIEK